MDKQPLRRACNRCHGLKLRCDRSVSEKHCKRCLKARATCVFGLYTRGRQPIPSARSTREELVTGNFTDNTSIYESPANDPEASPDSCRDDLPPDFPCQYVQHATPFIPNTLSPPSLADFTCSDSYPAGGIPCQNPRSEMDFLTNTPSPNLADSNVTAPMTNTQTHFQVQLMKDLLALDIELIQHTSTLVNPMDDILLQAVADRTLFITQQMLIILPWASCASCSQSWCLHTYPPWMRLESEQPDVSLDQTSTLHTLSTYLRLVEVCEVLFTRAASNINAGVANDPWNSFSLLHVHGCPVDRLAMKSAISIQSSMPLLDRLSDTMQLLAMPFIETNVVKAMLATICEHEHQMRQNFAQLQEVVSLWQ